MHKFLAMKSSSFFQFLFLSLTLSFFSCKQEHVTATKTKLAFSAEEIHFANRKLVELSMEDIYSPPVATRVFAYPNLACYEVFCHSKGFSPINTSHPGTIKDILTDTVKIDYTVASMIAFVKTARKLAFSEHLMDSLRNNLMKKLEDSGIDDTRAEASVKYGEAIADQIAIWIDKDNYAKVKSDDFYSVKSTDSSWVLTPPTYDSALEPNWKKLRPLFLPNLEDFKPAKRPPFSKDKNSEFYKNAKLVYDLSKDTTSDHRSIAKHWDCNPNEYNNKGHNTYFLHRISPPGHWVGITTKLCRQNNADFSKTALTFAAVTSAMFDGVISCWNTKFTEELIRPVTYINRYIDKTWEPLIQTPPFPEYTSGHSVMSGASTQILASMYNNTSFIDSTEMEFNLPPRKFKSIVDAGEEASLSRLYGGIHYKFGIDNGLNQGRKIGDFVLSKLKKD